MCVKYAPVGGDCAPSLGATQRLCTHPRTASMSIGTSFLDGLLLDACTRLKPSPPKETLPPLAHERFACTSPAPSGLNPFSSKILCRSLFTHTGDLLAPVLRHPATGGGEDGSGGDVVETAARVRGGGGSGPRRRTGESPLQRLVRLREETAMLAEDLEEMSKVCCGGGVG